MCLKKYHQEIKQEGGQAALETLAVLMLFFLITAFFLLSMFFLLGRVNAQGILSQATKEVASLGCVPELLDPDNDSPDPSYDYNEDFLRDRFSVWGAQIQGNVSWQYRDIKDSVYTGLPLCTAVFREENPASPAPSGSLVRGSVVYNQNIPIFSSDSTISFEGASSSLEEG
jgi:hypothetical protein